MNIRDIKFTNDVSIAYGVGKIRALENRMIQRSAFEQMSETSLDNVFKSITEYGYSENLDESIEMNKKENYYLITGMLNRVERYRPLSNVYLLKEDCMNLKNYLKSKLLGDSRLYYRLKFNPCGKLNEKQISEVVDNKKYNIIDPEHTDIIEKYLTPALEEESSSMIEHLIDRMYIALVFKIIEESMIDYLKFYFQEYVDLINIENLIRFKILNKNFEMFLKFYFEQGSLKLKDLNELYNGKIEDIPSKFKIRGFYNVLAEGIEYWLKNGSLSLFEKKKDDYLINLAKLTKVLSFGVEPLFGYLFGKEIEYKNLRIIINSKRIKLKPQTIKEKLRESYV